ncbi:MAG: thermonuclease family protein [candidate division Zixibacteria bacterium]|nr:thermonuclease family protein [candidate division Zixibacteria bacterium]
MTHRISESRSRDRSVAGRTLRAILLSFAIAACLSLSCGKKDPLRNLEKAVVTKVIDGDTIELDDGRTVRMLGIDTPEKGQAGADSATVANTALVLGKTVRLEYGRERFDRYGRTLAYVYVDRRMANREILRAGWAYCYFFAQNLTHARELVQALDSAMVERRGLWKSGHPETADHYVGSESGFRFHKPDCRSVSEIRRDSRVKYSSRDSAIYHGFSPCRNCAP